MRVRERNDLNPCRDNRVKPGKDVSANNSQRSALTAVAKIIATGEQVIAPDMLIDLRDQAVESVSGWRIHLLGEGAISIVAGCGQNAPWIRVQNVLNNRIDAAHERGGAGVFFFFCADGDGREGDDT